MFDVLEIKCEQFCSDLVTNSHQNIDVMVSPRSGIRSSWRSHRGGMGMNAMLGFASNPCSNRVHESGHFLQSV